MSLLIGNIELLALLRRLASGRPHFGVSRHRALMPLAELRALSRRVTQPANTKLLALSISVFTVLLSKYFIARITINKKAPVVRLGPFYLLGAWRCTTLAWQLPHYHRRSCVSLLSSEWSQVVPQRYCHQAKTCLNKF